MTRQEPLALVRSLFVPGDHTRVAAIGIWRDDARLGYAHVPLASGRHQKPDFDVRYSIDGTGCRVTPDPLEARGVVLVLGDSFTFGHGVEDAEAYPAVLGARHWRTHKVRNCASMGWGTGQAALVLDDALTGSSRPAAVVYGWVWLDSKRNYLRASWLKNQARYGRRNVHFEIFADQLAYQGTAGPEIAIADDAPELPGKERALTLALVRHMAGAAAAASAAFYVVLLPFGDPAVSIPLDEDLVSFMRGSGIAFVDLRRLESKGSSGPLGLDKAIFFPGDGHPRPAWHAAVAAAIAAKIPLE